MSEKKSIKQSEARILVYLANVHNTRKHVTAIAHKLEIDYSYVMRVLQAMVGKGWLTKHQYRRHMFYDLTPDAPLEEAKKGYKNDELAQMLIQTYSTEEITTKKVKSVPEVIKKTRQSYCCGAGIMDNGRCADCKEECEWYEVN